MTEFTKLDPTTPSNAALPSSIPHVSKGKTAVVGFDGFTDHIISVVATRESSSAYTAMQNIQELSDRIRDSSGVSCNIELVTKETRAGGNAPLLANALIELGTQVTFMGAIGSNNKVEPLFQPMAKRCQKTVTLAASGETDALEFSDGKVLLGKHEALIDLSYDSLLAHISKPLLTQTLDKCDLFASVNWTMLPNMNQLWMKLQSEILPHLSQRERFLFVDLADPTKRGNKELLDALKVLQGFSPAFKIVLGLNEKEIGCITQAVDVAAPVDEASVMGSASGIRKEFSFHIVTVHTKKFALAVGEGEPCILNTPPCDAPLITTGAGDHYNAGFCSGLLQGAPLIECVGTGIAVAGYYIRHGTSPSYSDLERFLQELQ